MLKLILNISSIIFGAVYFALYYSYNYNPVFFEFFIKYSWGKEFYSILNGIIAFLIVIGIIGILVSIFKIIFDKFFPNTLFLSFILKTINFTKYFLGLNAFIYFAIVPSYLSDILKKVYSIGIIIIFLVSITTIITNVFKYKVLKNPKLKLEQEAKTLLPFLEKVAIVGIWVLGLITIFSNLGYNVNAFIAGAGIGGLAIAFAAQKSISNIFGAVTILLNKPFKVGDSVRINGITGTIKDIGLSYVEMTETTGHKVMVPNDSIISTNIENFSTRKNRKTTFIIGITYDTTTLKLQKGIDLIKEILEKYKTDGTISSYRVNFSDFGEFSLNINVLYYSLYNQNLDEYHRQKEQINFDIKKAFDSSKIDIAFPTQEIIVKK